MTIKRTSIVGRPPVGGFCWRFVCLVSYFSCMEVVALSSFAVQPSSYFHWKRTTKKFPGILQVSSHDSQCECYYEDKHATGKKKNDGRRRREFLTKGLAASAALVTLSMTDYADIVPASATTPSDSSSSIPIRLSATWSATSGLNTLNGPDNDPKNFVSFDPSAYAAMRDDPSRTPLFKKALQERLNGAPGGPQSQTVLDLGTGPFALFAILAAEYGAGKVFAIEANPVVANSARETIQKQGWGDVITVLDGFSTDISLPLNEKADIIVAEVVGSIASEEGAYATILDAHKRLLKDPTNSNNWIPNRIQTWAAPASYTLHNLFTPPEFDWTKIAAEPVRFNCRDLGLALLDDPQCVEDIRFADIVKDGATNKQGMTRRFYFKASAERMEETTAIFSDEYRKGKLPQSQASKLASRAAHSCTGIAFWPRLFLPSTSLSSKGGDSLVINSRSHPDGGPQRSHWQTVLPIMCARPVEGIRGGDRMEVTCVFATNSETVKAAPTYSVVADIYATAVAPT